VPNPQTITVTPEMLFAGFEGTQFLSSADVTVAAVLSVGAHNRPVIGA